MQQRTRCASFIFLILLAYFSSAMANVIQYFWQTNYSNPAELTRVSSFELIAGAMPINTYIRFRGSAEGGVGRATSNQSYVLPYGLIGKRLSPNLVAGINFSNPIYSNIDYGPNSILRVEGTRDLNNDIDINPQLSYKINDKLSIGGGFIANDNYRQQVNFVVSSKTGNVINKTSAWAYGWDAGLFYSLDKKNNISFAYFSGLKPHFKGTSSSSALGISQWHTEDNINLPATYFLGLVHIFDEKRVGFIRVYYSTWNNIRTVIFNNVVGAGQIPFVLNYRNTFDLQVGGGYQFKPKWSFIGAFIFDSPAANRRSRVALFPSAKVYVGVVGLSYDFNKTTNIQALYGSAFVNTALDHPLDQFLTFGTLRVNANTLDIRLTYKI